MKLTDFADETLDLVARAHMGLRDAISSLAEQASPLRGASYDSAGRSTQAWCWTHERPVPHCLEAGLFCAGEVIEAHDPTGERAAEQAMRGGGPGARLRYMERQWRIIEKAAHAIIDAERAEQPTVVVNDRAGIGPCDECGHRCEGGKDRLRPSVNGQDRLCDACRKRESRFKPTEAAS